MPSKPLRSSRRSTSCTLASAPNNNNVGPSIKRKASDSRKSGRLREVQERETNEKEHINSPVGSSPKSSNSPQKKQKRAGPQFSCKFDGCHQVFESEHELAVHQKSYGELERYVNSTNSGSEGFSYPETNTVDIENSYDSDSGEPSLTNESLSPFSISSGRSSPSSMDLESRGTIPLDYLAKIFFCDIMSNKAFETSRKPPRMDYTIPTCVPRSISVITEAAMPSSSLTLKPTDSGPMKNAGQRGEDRVDQSPVPTTATPTNARTPPTAPSFAGTENPSTEGDRSTQSHVSDDSDSERSEETPDGECSNLEGVIKDVLRTDEPEVIKMVFRDLDGKLECAPPHPNDRFEDSDLALLSLLDLQDPRPIENSGAFTTYAPSSSSGSSSSSHSQGNFEKQGGGASSSSTRQNSGSRDNPTGQGSNVPNENRGPGQSTKQQKNTAKSNVPHQTTSYPFRCIHNALAPEIFCVTHETQKKYSTCAGPGWNTIQHLKDHMKSHHTKKPNPLQCSRCQEEFENQETLKHHELSVDCLIKCPNCPLEFDRKALRQAHQEEEHVNDDVKSKFIEIDESMDEKIKKNLKSYGDALKKGKSIDAAMEKWIEANTKRYMIGRRSTANAKLELGQWYTIFRTLSSREVLIHPFYDFGMIASDVAQEKIMLINSSVVNARIEGYGPPPAELQEQRAWYQDALRDSLKLAAKTLLIPAASPGQPSERSSSTTTSPYTYETSTGGPQTTPYSMPNMDASYSITQQHEMTPAHSSQLTGMDPHLSWPSNYIPNDQQSIDMMGPLSTVASDTTSRPSPMISQGIPNIEWDGHHSGMEQNFESTFDFPMPTPYDGYPPAGSNIPEQHQYPSNWSMEQRRRR